LSDVREVVQRVLDSPDILAPQLPTHAFAFADPVDLAWQVVDLIDKRVDQHTQNGTPIERIVFIGYSFGGLLARMVYVLACGETQTERWIVQDEDGNLRPLFASQRPGFIENRKWAGRVQRLVLLAGMNRGWTIDFRVAGLFRTGVFRVSERLVILLERLINLGRWLVRKPHRTAFGLTFRKRWQLYQCITVAMAAHAAEHVPRRGWYASRNRASGSAARNSG
jgi:hypothetical protein